MAGNQIRSAGGWQVQEGSEVTWVGDGMSGALRQLNSPWMYSFPGIPSSTWGSNRGEPINYPHLPHPHVCCEEGGS